MDIAAFVVSVFALLASAGSAVAAHRQARSAKAQAKFAEDANRTANAALELARQAEQRETERQHTEERPNFVVSGKRAKGRALIVTVTITNQGPLGYENVVVKPDMDNAETKRLVRGMGRRSDHLADEVALGSIKPGETLTTALVRTSADEGGKAKLIVTSHRAGREWESVEYVPVVTPPRMYAF